MNDLTPLVSICIPSYNNQDHIQDTLLSVIRQSYRNWELIIVDDYSTDQTIEVVRTLLAGLPPPDIERIRILVNPQNYGAAANFNRAILQARGKYTKLLCGDDILYPDCIEQQVRVFESPSVNQEIALVCSQRNFIDDSSRTLFTGKGLGPTSIFLSREIALKRMVRSGTNLIGEPACVLFPTALLNQIGTFNENHSYVIDLDMWCRLLSVGPLYFISKPLCAFRIAKRSWSVRIGKSQSTQVIHFFRELRCNFPQWISRSDFWIGAIKAKIFTYLRHFIYLCLSFRISRSHRSDSHTHNS